MKRIFAGTMIAAIASFALVGAAQAQVTVPPGQDFYAARMNKGPMMTMPQAQISQAAPAAKPTKHRMRKKMTGKMTKKRM